MKMIYELYITVTKMNWNVSFTLPHFLIKALKSYSSDGELIMWKVKGLKKNKINCIGGKNCCNVQTFTFWESTHTRGYEVVTQILYKSGLFADYEMQK